MPKSATDRPNIFISYARSDAAIASWIAEALDEVGGNVFYDKQLDAGESWARTLADGIQAADRVIVLMSPEYFASRWCQAELSEAFNYGKPIIPALVKECEPTGPLSYLQWLDLRGGPADARRLISAVMRST